MRGSLSAVVGLVALAGCASVKVSKVPTPGNYENWCDDRQKEADAMTGIRFYMPRPYVNVYEQFPLRSEAFFVTGELADGDRVLINVDPKSRLGKLLGLSAETGASKDVAETLQKLAIPLGAMGRADAGKADAAAPTSASVAPTQSQASETPKTGTNQQKVTNDNSAIAITPLRRFMDIVYLPDFDEQYVADSDSWLGNARMELHLGQGWSLQGYDAESDNSEVNKRIFDLMDTAIKAAKIAGSSALGGLPLAPAALLDQEAQALRDQKRVRFTLKVYVQRHAVPGLYPILKPRELVAKAHPAFANKAEATALALETIVLPALPYTAVAFNTTTTIEVEVVSSSVGAAPAAERPAFPRIERLAVVDPTPAGAAFAIDVTLDADLPATVQPGAMSAKIVPKGKSQEADYIATNAGVATTGVARVVRVTVRTADLLKDVVAGEHVVQLSYGPNVSMKPQAIVTLPAITKQ